MKPVQFFVKDNKALVEGSLRRTGFVFNLFRSLFFLILFSDVAIAASEDTNPSKDGLVKLSGRGGNAGVRTLPVMHNPSENIKSLQDLPNISATITLENAKSDHLGYIGASSIEIKEHFLIPVESGHKQITLSKFFDNEIDAKETVTKEANSVFMGGIDGFKLSGVKATLNADDLVGNNIAKPFDARVAIVDVEAIFEHSIAIKDIRHKINKISNKIQKEMSQREIELKKLESELIKQRGVIPESEFNEKLTEFNRRVSSTQQLLQQRKIALDRAHSEAISAVHKNSVDIIAGLAKKYGFNLVIPATQVVYVENDLNITMEVISSLNKKLTHIDVNYDAGE